MSERQTHQLDAWRFFDPDGQLSVEWREPPRTPLSDLYHVFLVAKWRRVIAAFILVYVAANCLFAGLYLLVEGSITNAKPGSFADAFFFSVQTMSTIGYGNMSPHGTYANVLVTAEAIIGIMAVAMATGIMFAKFARPTARVMFSRHAVIDRWMDGQPALMFRMANARSNQITEAAIHLTLIRNEKLPDGRTFRRFHDLKLVRDLSPIFALTWTVIHVLDEDSPLSGLTFDELEDIRAELLVTLSGVDQTFSQRVHARHSYVPTDVVWNARFADILGTNERGGRVIDYGRFHETIPH